MKNNSRSCLVLASLTLLWAPLFFAAGFCQTMTGHDRLNVGVYPIIAASSSAARNAVVPATPDSAFARLATHLTPLLVSALHEENLNVLPPQTFSDFLQSRPNFDPFYPDSVRKLCAAFTMQKLVLPIISQSPEAPAVRMRLILRWLDGASGEVTKSHLSEHKISIVDEKTFALTDSFDAKALIQALLNGPELIISQDEAVAPLPLPLLSEPAITNPKSKKWLWYLSAAAVIGGGSAYWFLGREGTVDEPTVLPEPPGPPPQ